MLLEVLGGAAVAAAGLAHAIWGHGRPRHSGTFRLPGLKGAVRVRRDGHGVPHIEAESAEDAAAALGWCHAQDRLWQLELNRRVGRGELCELFGAQALPADRFLRRMGLRRAAEAEWAVAHEEERRVLEAYAHGVNAALAEADDRRPLEFRLLGLSPRAWTPVDSLSWHKVMALNLSTNAQGEQYRMELIAKVGAERAAHFEFDYPEGQNLALPPGMTAHASHEELARLYAEAAKWIPLGMTGASNNWVVAGSRTTTGAPLLSNDPHLLLTVPSIWYQAHLCFPGVDAYGVTLPGLPGIVLGHTANVAWGVTNSGADVQDLFVERFDPQDPTRVEFQGAYEPVSFWEEEIRVKDGESVHERIAVTRHGPVIAGGPGTNEPALAMKWTLQTPGHSVETLLAMHRAPDAAAFREALRGWHTPHLNFVFADREHIGFVMAGLLPERAQGSGLTPVPGWSGEWEWKGFVPFEQLPQSWDPPEGFIATANQRIRAHGDGPHLSWDFMTGIRAARIVELLQAKPKLSAEDFTAIHLDAKTLLGPRFVAAVRALQLRPKTAHGQMALAKLLDWDGVCSTDSVGASVYEAWQLAAQRRAMEPSLGKELLLRAMGGSRDPLASANLLAGRANSWLVEKLERNDVRMWAGLAPQPTWREVMEAALQEAVDDLADRSSSQNVDEWSWGRFHQLKLLHPLGAAVPALGLIFNGPTVAISGDNDSPFQTAMAPTKPFGADAWAPSWRQVCDLADRSRNVSVLPTGQSGHPGHRNALDQFPLWLAGRFHPDFTAPADVAREAVSDAVLLP